MLPKKEVEYVQAQLTPERRARIHTLLRRIGRLRPEKALAETPTDTENATLVLGHLRYLAELADHHLSQFPAGILHSVTKHSLQKLSRELFRLRTNYAVYDPEDDDDDDDEGSEDGSLDDGPELDSHPFLWYLPTACIGRATVGMFVSFQSELDEMLEWFKHPKRHYGRRCELVSMTPAPRDSDVELPY